jgi:multidrug efflux pump subunit AcrA (membrane-fusion protein)
MFRFISLSLALTTLVATPVLRDDFRTQTVRRDHLNTTVQAPGTLEPEVIIDVGAQVSGQIVRFGADLDDPKKPIDFNSRVEPGTVLDTLDPAPFQARVDKSRCPLFSPRCPLFSPYSSDCCGTLEERQRLPRP